METEGFDRDEAMKMLRSAFRTSPGYQLSNGATILESRERRKTDWSIEYHVLALAPRGVHPFVTWVRVTGVEQRADGSFTPTIDYCFSGEYYHDIRQAVEDWNKIVS